MARKEVVFDDQGNTVDEIEVPDETPAVPPVTDEEPEGEEPEVPAPPATPPAHKYRIGDKTFATQDEALAYAASHVSALETETQVADAYRQGLIDARAAGTPPAPGVTPPAPASEIPNTEELYTNPQAFLDRFAKKIQTETLTQVDQRQALVEHSNTIWREFTERHPVLADFRGEVEAMAAGNQETIRAITATKGRTASYDWIATKLRSRFDAYQNALKPSRELPNGGGNTPPARPGAGVTPETPAKKPLSMAQQIRSMKQRR